MKDLSPRHCLPLSIINTQYINNEIFFCLYQDLPLDLLQFESLKIGYLEILILIKRLKI